MTHLPLISELQETCWAVERISKQLTTLITLTHLYQPLLLLLQRNSLEVCILIKKHPFQDQRTELTARIPELTLLISLLRDYAFESIEDERVDSHLTQIKEGLKHCLVLITHISDAESVLEKHSVEVI